MFTRTFIKHLGTPSVPKATPKSLHNYTLAPRVATVRPTRRSSAGFYNVMESASPSSLVSASLVYTELMRVTVPRVWVWPSHTQQLRSPPGDCHHWWV